MSSGNPIIKFNKFVHDAKATLWTNAGLHLEKIIEHDKIIDKLLIQEESVTSYANELETSYYGTAAPFTFFHPRTYLHVLRDVWVVGSEGYVFFEPRQLFSICSSLKGVAERKIRRPIRGLAEVIEEPVFILASRAPGNRGHFFMEHLPRLMASREAIKQLGPCKYLVTPRHRKWQLPYLQRLGIPETEVIEASIGSTFCKRAYYVPTLCEGEIVTASREIYYKSLRHLFLDGKSSSIKGTPIFLSRKDAPDRRLANEDTLFSITQNFFPDIRQIELSTLSVHEQISLFRDAPVIIGPHSQSFRNILFSGNALVVQLIQGFREPKNEYYRWAQNYNYLGNIGDNACLPLFSGIEFHTNSDWIYPEDKFKQDMFQLLDLIGKEKNLSHAS